MLTGRDLRVRSVAAGASRKEGGRSDAPARQVTDDLMRPVTVRALKILIGLYLMLRCLEFGHLQ
jgi:hypothetical protein